MAVYQPSELIAFLSDLGIRPKKALSQNFLVDGNIIRKIISTVAISPGDVVLEIGPGPGALTQLLLAAGATVIAVEKDHTLAQALTRLNTPEGRLHVYEEDIMEFKFDEILAPYLATGKLIKVIANLPYHLTTPIIAELVRRPELFSTLVLMVQKEVAERFTSAPDTRAYSSFTVFLNFYCHPRYAFTVSRNCFLPKPKVESAVVALELHPAPKISDETGFFKLTRTSFEHRRKMLRASLRDLYPPEKIMQALEEIGFPPTARPEQLSLDDFLRLFACLSKVSIN